ncbi:MAG: helix-turn-helix transcriptional regulator [Clostridiales bacterium]|nr:helix-turn-helix transcriptional regulator [Clostridiales bacterium]
MEKQTFGNMIAALRKEKGMTQLELAEKMGVTDKAVSKWERDLSFPDINSISRLSEILGVTIDELMQVKSDSKENVKANKISEIIELTLKAVPLAMGIAVVVLTFIHEIEINAAISMLGIGLACLAVNQLANPKK